MQGYGLASRVLSHEASSLAFCYFLNLPWRPLMVKFFHPTMSACNLTLIGQLKEQKPRACKQILENYACTLGRKVNFNKTLVYINSDVTTVHTYIMLQRTMGLNIHGKKKKKSSILVLQLLPLTPERKHSSNALPKCTH